MVTRVACGCKERVFSYLEMTPFTSVGNFENLVLVESGNNQNNTLYQEQDKYGTVCLYMDIIYIVPGTGQIWYCMPIYGHGLDGKRENAATWDVLGWDGMGWSNKGKGSEVVISGSGRMARNGDGICCDVVIE